MKRYAFFFTCMFCIVVCIRAGQQPGSRQVSRDAKKPVGTSPRSDRLHLYDVASLLSYVQQLQPDTALQGSSVQQLLPSEAVAGILEKGDSILLMLGNALDTAETSGDTVLQSALYRLMAEVYKLQHNYIASVAAWEKHDRLARLIAEKSRLRDIALIRTTEKRKHDFTSMYIIAIALVIVVIILAVSFRRTTVLNRKLQEAIGIRDKLFSVIGHDLRGPTGNLVQGLELVGTKTLSKATEDTILNGLLRQARNLSDTLLTLLTWARTQLKGIKINPQRFDPKEAIERTENLLEGHRHQKNITIATHIPDNVSIHTDRDKFDFIIRNLLSNAIKFSNTGGHIEVSASLVRDEIVFSVKDNGVGLTEEQRQQFITQGLQSGTGTAGEKGTGLGLLLIKDFIQSAGGRIWVQSEPGAGATFSFTLGNTK